MRILEFFPLAWERGIGDTGEFNVFTKLVEELVRVFF